MLSNNLGVGGSCCLPTKGVGLLEEIHIQGCVCHDTAMFTGLRETPGAREKLEWSYQHNFLATELVTKRLYFC